MVQHINRLFARVQASPAKMRLSIKNSGFAQRVLHSTAFHLPVCPFVNFHVSSLCCFLLKSQRPGQFRFAVLILHIVPEALRMYQHSVAAEALSTFIDVFPAVCALADDYRLRLVDAR